MNSKHLFIKQLANLDQRLPEFKTFYRSQSPEERQRIFRWVEQLAKLNDADVLQSLGATSQWHMGITVDVALHPHDQDGNEVYSGEASILPQTLLKALKSWDSGEDYAPQSIFSAV